MKCFIVAPLRVFPDGWYVFVCGNVSLLVFVFKVAFGLLALKIAGVLKFCGLRSLIRSQDFILDNYFKFWAPYKNKVMRKSIFWSRTLRNRDTPFETIFSYRTFNEHAAVHRLPAKLKFNFIPHLKFVFIIFEKLLSCFSF